MAISRDQETDDRHAQRKNGEFEGRCRSQRRRIQVRGSRGCRGPHVAEEPSRGRLGFTGHVGGESHCQGMERARICKRQARRRALGLSRPQGPGTTPPRSEMARSCRLRAFCIVRAGEKGASPMRDVGETLGGPDVGCCAREGVPLPGATAEDSVRHGPAEAVDERDRRGRMTKEIP